MKKFLIAGNWKMNTLPSEVSAFWQELNSELNWNKQTVEVSLALPATHLFEGTKHLAAGGVKVAAQNIHWEKSGAYTGEISIPMLKDIGIEWTLIGHSERRQFFAESDETVALKFKSCLENGIMPIVCCGETQAERESQQTEEVISKQLIKILELVSEKSEFVIAYEPVWAIGTGLTASNEQAQKVHAFIRSLVAQKLGEKAANVKILYGGSAKPGNLEGLLGQKDIDGALIGGASLKPRDFSEMISIATRLS